VADSKLGTLNLRVEGSISFRLTTASEMYTTPTQHYSSLINEYNIFPMPNGFVPACANLTNTRHSFWFLFSEINGRSDYAWALVKDALIAPSSSGYGLDKWRENYGSARTISSGYRNPVRNRHQI
jgi:hypothetical protein